MRTIFTLIVATLFQNIIAQEKELLIIGTMHEVPSIVSHSYRPLLKYAKKYKPEAIFVEDIRPDDTLSLKNYTPRFLKLADSISHVNTLDEQRFHDLRTKQLTEMDSNDFARVNYDMSLNGIELRVPVALYFGEGEHLRPYFYLAPRLDVWLGGNVHWERTYDDASFQPITFDSELTDAMTLPFDFSAEAGVGLCSRLKLGRRAMYIKLDVGYGFSLLSNFSQGEVNEEVAFEGWGDIAHEHLGQRHLQNAEVRLTLLLPLQKLTDDACSFNQRPYRPK